MSTSSHRVRVTKGLKHKTREHVAVIVATYAVQKAITDLISQDNKVSKDQDLEIIEGCLELGFYRGKLYPSLVEECRTFLNLTKPTNKEISEKIRQLKAHPTLNMLDNLSRAMKQE
jgi:hypothetical protein